jgi:hypothetical protein
VIAAPGQCSPSAGSTESASRSEFLLCGWFNLWWIFWSFNLAFAQQFLEWKFAYLLFWVASVAILVYTALKPLRRFRGQLDSLYGGAEAQLFFARQLELVRADLKRIDEEISRIPTPDPIRLNALRARRSQLTAFADGLADRVSGDWLMRPWVIVGFAAGSGALMLLMVLLDQFGWPMLK